MDLKVLLEEEETQAVVELLVDQMLGQHFAKVELLHLCLCNRRVEQHTEPERAQGLVQVQVQVHEPERAQD